MAKRNVTVRMIADHEYEAVNPQGNRVEIDMHDPEEKKFQSPMDMLLSAVGSCASVDAVLMMRKKRREIVGFFVEVEGIRSEGVPSFFTDIHMKFILISPDAKDLEFEKVIALAVDKYCSVASSLKSNITYSTEIKRS